MTTPELRKDAGADSGLRRVLLALTLLGIVGLTLELVLLEHTESVEQWIPLAVLGAGLAAAVAAGLRPGRATVLLLRAAMAACILTGVLGLYLHLRGNTEFELEMDPSLRGLGLLWLALRGATPALAPGAMAQLGLLGLAYTYRHPALSRPAAAPRGPGAPPKERR